MSEVAPSLIIEGGGLRGFFAAGALARLRQEGVSFPYVIGMSSGALVAVAYLAGVEVDPDSLPGGPRAVLGFLNPRGLVRPAEGLLRPDALVRDLLGAGAFERALRADARLLVGATDALTGELAWWDQRDCADAAALASRVRASCAIPAVMPRARVDGRVYADGGFVDSLPLARARADGRTRHVVIGTRPDGYRKGRAVLGLYQRALLRGYPALRRAMLTRPERYNASMELVEQAERAGEAVAIRPERDWHGRFVYSRRAFGRDWQLGWDAAGRALPRVRELLS